MAPLGSYRPNEFQAFKAAAGALPSGTPRRILIVSAILFLAVFLAYFGLNFGYKVFLKNSIEDLKAEIKTISAQVSPAEQENLVKLYSQINNLQKILVNHNDASPAFLFLETNTQPRVVFNTANLSVPDREMVLEGAAGSYEELAVQLAIFENSPSVERVFLESSQASGNVVRFRIVLELEPQMFLVKQ